MLLNQTKALERRISKIEKKRGEKKEPAFLLILERDSEKVKFKIELPSIK